MDTVMQLVHPDILADARGLSVGAAGFALLVGSLLWGLGWRWHRFWIVFGITLTAGIMGLNAGQAMGGQVLAVGILLALTAGMMALEIARVLAFVAGGIAAWIAVQSVLPGAREMWAVFLCGGLLGLLLYRLWAMMLASFAGALLGTYGAMLLSQALFKTEIVEYARKNTVALNATVLILTFLGVVLQHYIAQADNARAEAESAALAEAAKKKSKNDDEDDDVEADIMPWWWRLVNRAA
jgi:hypothetical protein